MKKILWLTLVAALFTGCYYDNEEHLYPNLNSVCDTTSVTFSGSVQPILGSNCLSCHSAAENAASGGNVNLGDYNSVKKVVDDGRLYGAIKHDPAYAPMPKGGTQLDACSITKIKIWIDHGAVNN